MKIGIDFDSTLAKIDATWLERFNRVRGTTYSPDDWADWELSFLPPADRKLFLELFTPDIYDSVVPYPGAAEAVRKLARIPGVELLCVTSTPKHKAAEFNSSKKKWLAQHIPELSDKVIMADRKIGLGLDILVDDAPHHHIAPDCKAILVKRPWNQKVQSEFAFSDWEEGFKVLEILIMDILGKLPD